MRCSPASSRSVARTPSGGWSTATSWWPGSNRAARNDPTWGSIARLEERRWGGTQHLAHRLGEQGLLRADVSVEEAADVLWIFASFDALYTGRGLSADEIARILATTAERTLCR